MRDIHMRRTRRAIPNSEQHPPDAIQHQAYRRDASEQHKYNDWWFNGT
jgi:hypothetical protein